MTLSSNHRVDDGVPASSPTRHAPGTGRGGPVTTWVILVAATVAALVLGVERSWGSRIAAPIIIVLCAVKMLLIGTQFMELRRAHRAVLLIFCGYVAVLCAVLLGFYS
jgi:heme/copper-type cytochrome/quinol oxidase subunit 4